MPPPQAGWNYRPNKLNGRTHYQQYAHINGYAAEIRLANELASDGSKPLTPSKDSPKPMVQRGGGRRPAVTATVRNEINHLPSSLRTGNHAVPRTILPVERKIAGGDKSPATKRTETYFRVEGGGSGNKTSQNRIKVNQDGTIKIDPKCTGQLCVSTKGADHAKYYLSERRSGGQVVVFEIDTKVHNDIMKNLVPQKPAPGTKNHPNAPKLVDINKPGFAIELPEVWNERLEKGSSKGRVMSQDEFFKEFGNYEKD